MTISHVDTIEGLTALGNGVTTPIHPGIGPPIVSSRFGERYAIGPVVEEGRQLFVSSGIGTSILPVRFLVPPEVSVLGLRAAAQPGAESL